ncbi:MAG: HI0074 family nucleotidyltransferase substrate-binding subunit [Ignavibacteria bacterium]|jgi:nucleotidyltransferase substrate binding protein (TIGR01987 family)
MKDEVKFALQQYTNAIRKLDEGTSSAIDELDKDGVIQRFEFTIELLWKMLKLYLEDQGIICNTPKECLKAAFRIGLIDNEEAFLNMLQDRNKMSHLYSKEESEEIYERIKTLYLPNLKKIPARIPTS